MTSRITLVAARSLGALVLLLPTLPAARANPPDGVPFTTEHELRIGASTSTLAPRRHGLPFVMSGRIQGYTIERVR